MGNLLRNSPVLSTLGLIKRNSNKVEETRKQNKEFEKSFHGEDASSNNVVQRTLNKYVVKPGDYLSVIAKNLNIPLQTLLKDSLDNLSFEYFR